MPFNGLSRLLRLNVSTELSRVTPKKAECFYQYYRPMQFGLEGRQIRLPMLLVMDLKSKFFLLWFPFFVSKTQVQSQVLLHIKISNAFKNMNALIRAICSRIYFQGSVRKCILDIKKSESCGIHDFFITKIFIIRTSKIISTSKFFHNTFPTNFKL